MGNNDNLKDKLEKFVIEKNDNRKAAELQMIEGVIFLWECLAQPIKELKEYIKDKKRK